MTIVIDPTEHSKCCLALELICPFCNLIVPHYPGGTVSDIDDVIHLISWDKKLRWAHRDCWLDSPRYKPCWS